jgi:hypothetical protein
MAQIVCLYGQKRAELLVPDASFVTTPDSFSCEAWVKTNQKNAMQQGGECGVGQLYSYASRPVSVGSCDTEPSSLVLPSISHSLVRWFRPHSQWLNSKTWQHWTAYDTNSFYRSQAAEGFVRLKAVPNLLLWMSQRRSSFIRKWMKYSSLGKATCLSAARTPIRSCDT